jgi:hypothetical protein
MKRRKIVILIVLSLILVLLLNPITLSVIITQIYYVKARNQLLFDTNYYVLLEAGRELSKRVQTGELKPGDYQFRFKPNPEITSFPKAILDMHPAYIYINDDGAMKIELLGSMGHFGINVYPKDYNPFSSKYKFGDIELIPGLWYYDERINNSSWYYNKLSNMIEKAKSKEAH